MARPKQKWTSQEEAALAAGVEKYRPGKWSDILKDPRFHSILVNRTNVDLKDKWRNLKGSDYGSSRRGNARTSGTQVIDDLLISSLKRRAPPYKVMIYESLSSIEDPNGTDVKSMGNFLESKYMLPTNYRRSLTETVRKLVRTGDLEKVNNRYKLKGTSSGAETSQQEGVRTNNVDNTNEEQVGPDFCNEVQLGPQSCSEEPMGLAESVEDEACVAAYQVALAETREGRVIKDCEDKHKLAELLDESSAMLMLAEELHERCKKQGTITLHF